MAYNCEQIWFQFTNRNAFIKCIMAKCKIHNNKVYQVILRNIQPIFIWKNIFLLLSSHGTNFDWVWKEDWVSSNIIIYCLNLNMYSHFCIMRKTIKTKPCFAYFTNYCVFDDWGWYAEVMMIGAYTNIVW